jgi:Prokaryotic membrane lipoprotein lipid attachment site
MKRYFVVLSIAAALAACSPGQESGKGDEAATRAPATAPTATQAPLPREKGIDALAGFGIKPMFPYDVAYDIVDKNDKGRARHRVLLEVTGGDINAAVASMEQQLMALDYAKAKQSDRQGKIEQVFRKKGSPTLVLLSQSAASGPKLKQPGAVGSIHVMWNVQ